MKKILLLFIILLTGLSCQAQKKEYFQDGQCNYYYDKKLKEKIYITTEIIPQYPCDGGYGFNKFILENIDYSNVAEIWYEEGITPNYLCSIILDKKGKVVTCKIAENKNDKIAVRDVKKQIEKIILKGKEWTPAKCNGKEVYSVVNLKIRIPQSYYLK